MAGFKPASPFTKIVGFAQASTQASNSLNQLNQLNQRRAIVMSDKGSESNRFVSH